MKLKTIKQVWKYAEKPRTWPEQHQACTVGDDTHEKVLKYVLDHSEKGNIHSCIEQMDLFATHHWMMNIGPQKAKILLEVIKEKPPQKILEVGTYCGYSSLLMALHTRAKIDSFQINAAFADVAKKIHKHAGVNQRVNIILGKLQNQSQFLKQRGRYDLIFLDHFKEFYLSDLILLENNKNIHKGSVIIADNILVPGAPEYLKYLDENKHYQSTLYHCFMEYSDIPDAMLVSERIL